MKSSMCKGECHSDCHVVYQQPSGKTFRCDCSCHMPVKVYRRDDEFSEDEEDEDDDDY